MNSRNILFTFCMLALSSITTTNAEVSQQAQHQKNFRKLVKNLEALHADKILHTGCLRIKKTDSGVIINGRAYRRNPLNGGIEDYIKTFFREEGVNAVTAKFDDKGRVVSVEVLERTDAHRMQNSWQSRLWFWQKNNSAQDRATETVIARGVTATQHMAQRDEHFSVFAEKMMSAMFECSQGTGYSRCTTKGYKTAAKTLQDILDSEKLSPKNPALSTPEPTTPNEAPQGKQHAPAKKPVVRTLSTSEQPVHAAASQEVVKETCATEAPTEKFWGLDGGRTPLDRTAEENLEVAQKRAQEVAETANEKRKEVSEAVAKWINETFNK